MKPAMKDEMKKFTPQTMQVGTNETQTIAPQQASTINAIVITNAERTNTGTIQSLQFDENAQNIIASAITSTNSKKVKIRAINTTENPYTIPINTKVAEMQILTPEDTKHIRPIDIAALKILEDHDGAVAYIQELMKTDDQHEDNFWFPTPENPGNEHTPQTPTNHQRNKGTSREGKIWSHNRPTIPRKIPEHVSMGRITNTR